MSKNVSEDPVFVTQDEFTDHVDKQATTTDYGHVRLSGIDNSNFVPTPIGDDNDVITKAHITGNGFKLGNDNCGLSIQDSARFASFGNGGWRGLNGSYGDIGSFNGTTGNLALFNGNRVYRLDDDAIMTITVSEESERDKYRAGDIIYFVNPSYSNTARTVVFFKTTDTGAQNVTTSIRVNPGSALALMFIGWYQIWSEDQLVFCPPVFTPTNAPTDEFQQHLDEFQQHLSDTSAHGIDNLRTPMSFNSINDAMVYSASNPGKIIYAEIPPENMNGVLYAGQFYGSMDRIPLPTTGTPDTSWYNNTDTYFEIDNADKLAGLGQLVANTDSFLGKTVKLVRDIDLIEYSGGAGWLPIDNQGGSRFCGTFDGGGHSIFNLKINRATDHTGLFASLSDGAILCNIALIDVDITGTRLVGAVVGSMWDNCSVLNCYSTGRVKGTNEYVGGIIGGNFSIDGVSNCYSTCSVHADNMSAGGIAGTSQSGSVINCIALNTKISGGEYYIRRITGGQNAGATLINNAAFIGIPGTWNNKGADNMDGEDITLAEILADGTLGGRFTSANGWATQNGKLPGFGKPVDIPPHLLISRIPITSDLTLQISESGNDATGGLNSPFATPQGAYNWAVAKCDFKDVDALTINIDSGTYGALIINKIMQGLNKIIVNGVGAVTIYKIKISEANRVDLSNITINWPDSDSALAINNSVVYLTGNLTVTGNGSGCGIFIGHGGSLNGDSISSFSLSGNFGDMIRAEHAGLFKLSNSTLQFNGTVTGSVLNSVHHGDMEISNCNIAGTVTGTKYRVIVCSALNTGGQLSSIPGNVAGTSDASSYAN